MSIWNRGLRLAPLLAVLLASSAPLPAVAENLYEIDSDEQGFAVFRSGRPDAEDMAELCALGVTEMMVLSGNANEYEGRLASHCPDLKVVFDETQDPEVPVTAGFLRTFDAWVARAKERNTRIAFRCNCGCHRTGRLAAYYQMKHRGLSVAEAEALMMARGKWMFLFPGLKKQLRAMDDFIQGRPCSTKTRYCVQDG